MSTDFDSEAFSAVSSFFGNPHTDDREQKDVKLEPRRKHSDRLGVGATRDLAEEQRDEILDDRKTRNKILSIGNKRRRQDESEDEEEKESFTDDEDEVEGGRTSIQKKVMQTNPEIDLSKKSKKKKGKKERKAEKNSQKDQQHTQETSENFVEISNPEIQKTSGEMNPTNDTNAESHRSADHADNKTKKRRKVRSRQKNIRKDTRPSSQKPEHLRIGAKTYAGRPITKETREFLNLPESRTLALRRQREKNSHQSPKGHIVFGDGNLAVDEFLGGSFKTTSNTNMNALDNLDEIPDSGQVINKTECAQMNSNQKKPKAKKKKTKFKNLK